MDSWKVCFFLQPWSKLSIEEIKNKVNRYGDIIWLNNLQKNKTETIYYINKTTRKDEAGIYENKSRSE